MATTDKVVLQPTKDQLEIRGQSWISLGSLRELVKQADAHGWKDGCLVSHGVGSGVHPTLAGLSKATQIVVEGPS